MTPFGEPSSFKPILAPQEWLASRYPAGRNWNFEWLIWRQRRSAGNVLVHVFDTPPSHAHFRHALHDHPICRPDAWGRKVTISITAIFTFDIFDSFFVVFVFYWVHWFSCVAYSQGLCFSRCCWLLAQTLSHVRLLLSFSWLTCSRSIRFLCWESAWTAARFAGANACRVTTAILPPPKSCLRVKTAFDVCTRHITVDEQHDGALFFWHFQNKHIADRPRTVRAPAVGHELLCANWKVIWLNGGPGCSSEDVRPYKFEEGF